MPHAASARSALFCFSHLRWNFVYQRPQHLMTRCAASQPVYYIEEPVHEDVPQPLLRMSRPDDAVAVHVVVPVLPHGMSAEAQSDALRGLVDDLIDAVAPASFDAWYYTPMAFAFTDHLRPALTVYDCMDELGNFVGAPTAMAMMEQRLLARADVVFTGGQSLYEAKRSRHGNLHAFPSSIDRAHFAKARAPQPAPIDQPAIATPRLGFFGVIDERFDIELMRDVAALRPEWEFVLIGPVVKIDPATLPQAPNLRYLGMKRYDELPAYLAGWDVALMPFARNDATRYISPTKTPEYLAGGRPVVSTSIHDVVHPYADEALVHIADAPRAFVDACEAAIAQSDAAWLARVDAFLAGMSWDATWQRMQRLMAAARRQPEQSVAA